MKRTKPRKKSKVVKQEKPVDNKVYTLRELKGMLTEKQKVFCHEYIRDWNGSRAARAAKYAEDSSRITANKLLTKANIQQYINHIRTDIAKEVGISKIGLLSILKNHAEANMSDLLKDWITRKDLEMLKEQNPQLIKAIKTVDTKIIETVINKELYNIEYVKVTLYDSQKAISEIFKAMGWYEPEKVDLKAEVESKVDISIYSDEEKEMLLKMARKTTHHGL